MTSVTDPYELKQRLHAAATRSIELGLNALLITPGADLRYLTGYAAPDLERLTCLVVPALGKGDPYLVVPELEADQAQASPLGRLDIQSVSYGETADPYAEIGRRIGAASGIGLANRMWAEKVLAFRAVFPKAELSLSDAILGQLRIVKSQAEIEALTQAGRAIDRVHARVPELLRAGRSGREVARDIAEAILDTGHESVDFVIVGSGPNGASPHHGYNDRILEPGDQIVVDIGGTMPDGYCSDCTRTYSLGEPSEEFNRLYRVLYEAQEAARVAVEQAVPFEQIDAAARDVISAAGYGEQFLHRTGHGIGLETHEPPYVVEGNKELVRIGNTFSIEPGIYFSGRFGARIEDIVVATAEGAESLNNQPRELVIV